MPYRGDPLYGMVFARGKERMKTLILNGSPRKNGDTAYLLGVLTDHLNGEYHIINCYSDDISPCVDCRACRSESGCVIDDGMDMIYDRIKDCDNVVIASPVYFSQPTGELLSVCSRFQTYFSARYFRHEPVDIPPKRGAVILTAGGCGDPKPAYDTSRVILKAIGANEIYPMTGSFNTDNTAARDDAEAAEQVKRAAGFLNRDTDI